MEQAEQAATEILLGPDPPTAIFSGQNYFTIGAVKALRSLGLQHEVALIGFDDFALADLLDPAVTVVAHDPAEIGRTAAELLFRRLDGDAAPSQHIVCPVRAHPARLRARSRRRAMIVVAGEALIDLIADTARSARTWAAGRSTPPSRSAASACRSASSAASPTTASAGCSPARLAESGVDVRYVHGRPGADTARRRRTTPATARRVHVLPRRARRYADLATPICPSSAADVVAL